MTTQSNQNESWTVYLKGGSVGSIDKAIEDGKYHPKYGKIQQTFDSKEEAEEKAKRMNKLLSPGEKKYYRMKYHAKETTV